MWVRRIGSLLVGFGLLFGAGFFGIGLVLARQIDPVRIDRNLTRFVAECKVPGDIGDSCAFIDSDNFCYRLHPYDFKLGLPALSDRIGKPVSFVVDKENYQTSRIVGDPFCNFQVDQVIVTDSGQETRYSTRAMTEPEFVGYTRGDILPYVVAFLIVLGLLVGWNAVMEIRRYRHHRR